MIRQLRIAVLSSFVLMAATCTSIPRSLQQNIWLQSAQAASDTEQQQQQQLPVSKTVSRKELEKYQQISITIEEDGKQIKYTGVPLRVIFADMVPTVKLESMPEWKALSRRRLVMEVTGDDGYPGLVTAIELAINKEGDRFILATDRDGKPIEKGLQLICKMDQAHTRWVRQVVSLKVSVLTSHTD